MSVPEWLFEIIETNGKPDLDLVKYLLYKATGKDYGVKEYDFSEFDASKFTDVTGLYGDSIQEQVWWALIDAGYSKTAAAAVLGNIECESGFDPASIEAGNGIGLGLCQWSFGRRTQLEGYIAFKGTDTSDVQTQIEFLLGELKPGGGANGYASYELGGQSSSKYDGTSYTKDSWENATDIGKATTAFMALFERPSYDIGTNHLPARKKAAQKYYDQFANASKPSETGGNSNIVNTAKKKLGCSYVYGAAGPNTFDCSGFVQWVYGQNGISLPRTTYDYEPYIGTKHEVSWSEAKPGDIVWKSEHMGIYLGNDQYIHAPHTGDVVKISSGAKGTFTKVFRFTK